MSNNTRGYKLIITFCIAIVFFCFILNFVKISSFRDISWLFLAILLFILAIYVKQVSMVAIIFSALFLCFWRYSSVNYDKTVLSQLFGSSVNIQGVVMDDPEEDENGVKIKISTEDVASSKIKTIALARIADKSKNIKRSDKIELKGTIVKSNFSSYDGIVKKAKIINIIPSVDIARDFRDWASKNIQNYIHGEEGSLGLGYLLGEKKKISADLQENLRKTSLSHIVVASGYNLTILVLFVRRIFENKNRRMALLISLASTTFFMLMIGLSASMLRAGLVSTLGLFLWYYGRLSRPYSLLLFVASLTLIINPNNMLDLSWQLSFAAFFGVLILSPLIHDFLTPQKYKTNIFFQLFIETLSAQIMTVPIIALYFGTFSFISIITNMVILPLLPITMFFIFMVGLLFFIPTLATIFAVISNAILKLQIAIINLFASFPIAQSKFKINLQFLLCYYVIIVLLIIFLEYKNKRNYFG